MQLDLAFLSLLSGRPPLRCKILCLLLCAGALTTALAGRLSVSTEPTARERVTVTGSGLPAGNQVTTQLTTPESRLREGGRVGEDTRFRLETPLNDYQLVVRGQGLNKTRVLVQPVGAPSPPQENSRPGRSLTPEPAGAEPPARVALPDVTRARGGLEARQNGALRWRLSFPGGSGPTTRPLLSEGRLYVGHGNSVLRLDPRTGTVRDRFIVSGPVERLGRVDDAAIAVTVRHTEGLSERFTLRENAVQEPVRFGLDPQTFSYLRAEAAVRDPAARLERDPTNPWLYLATGLRQGRGTETARVSFARAVETATTFYDLAGLATVLERHGERALAARAFDAALNDFAARGYDPRLLRDATLEAAYTFPLTPLKAALARDDDLSAGFWAERLRLTAPNVPGAGEALSAYAAMLRVVAPPEDAALWERRAAEHGGTDQNALERTVTALARVGWVVALALLAAFLALHLTLLSKYAHARRADRAQGSRALPLFAVRYTTLSEKLVLLLILATVLACAALGNWYSVSRAQPVTGSGTLLNRAAQVYLDAGLNGPEAAFIRSYAAQVAGDSRRAQTLLRRAGDDAPALNNLGAATGNPALYRRALALEPGLDAARYNTGDTARLPFQAQYLPAKPALAAPTATDFQGATSGSWQTALAQAFTNPQLIQTPPPGLNLAFWRAAQLAFLLVVFVHVVFVFVPRPRSARDAPRPWGYGLLALLVPGSGLADEAWGVFLLVPWAVFGLGTLLQSGRSPLGLAPTTVYLVLAGVYLLNTVAVTVERLSHRSRRRALELHRADARRA